MLWPRHERLELVGADLDLAGDDRLLLGAALAAPAPAGHALHAGDDLFGVAGLRDPVVGAEAQPAYSLGDRRRAGADDDAQLGQAGADALQPVPGVRTEHGEVDDERAEAHGRHGLAGNGATEHAMLPAEPVQALGQHLDESGVPVEDGHPQRCGCRTVKPN